MNKRFILVRNNAYRTDETCKDIFGAYSREMSQAELVPVNSILKIWKYCPSEGVHDNVLVCEWVDPITKVRHEWNEMFQNPMALDARLKYLESVLLQ